MNEKSGSTFFIQGVGYLAIRTAGGLVKIPSSDGALIIRNGASQFVPFKKGLSLIVSKETTSHTLAFICLPRLGTAKEVLQIRRRLGKEQGKDVVLNM